MSFHRLQAIILFAIFFAISMPAVADVNVLRGKVVSIDDGDSLIIVGDNQRQFHIRLQGIDAPEAGQSFGTASQHNLEKLVFGKEVTVEWTKHDRYGRIVGYVFVESKDAGLEQVKAGLAWHYKYYQNEQTADERQAYSEAEQKAREKRLGLWRDPNPLPPWDFRHGDRAETVNVPKPVVQGTPQPKDPPQQNSRTYIRGPRGGCYYLDNSGYKNYVNHGLCKSQH